MASVLFMVTIVVGKVSVHDPEDLRSSFEHYPNYVIPSSLANFGNPPYGSSLIGRLYIPKDHPEACVPLRPIEFKEEIDLFNHPILLVTRGSCSFVVKVRNAQTIGASAVIIIDNTLEEPENIIMVDDGTAGNLYIPSVLISKTNGDILKKYMKNGNDEVVRMTISFDMPNPDNRVEYEIWMSSEQQVLRDFLTQFAPVAKNFGRNIKITPHYVLWYCVECSNAGYVEDHKDCLSGGRYCAPDPDYDGPRTGREIVMEDLRQICVSKVSRKQGNPSLWWDYILEFSKCDENNFNEKCANQALKNSGINELEVHNCIEDSFNGPKHELDDNKILSKERQMMYERSIYFYPSFIINNTTFRGDMEVEEIVVALCAGFQTKPQYCADYFSKTISKKGISAGSIQLIIFFSIVILLVILFFYRRWLRKDMNSRMRAEVTSAVSQYIALTDQNISKD